MTPSHCIVFFIALLLTSGCATSNVWSGNKKEYVKIIPKHKSEDVEITLKQSGRSYFCKELYASTYANNKICYMEKTEALKLQEKIIATPAALLDDIVTTAGTTIYIIGHIFLGTEMRREEWKGNQKQIENPSGIRSDQPELENSNAHLPAIRLH